MLAINEILEYLIFKTLELNKKHLINDRVAINYSAIFCQNDDEFKVFNQEASQIGTIIEETPTGPLYKFYNPIQTIIGPLWLMKIRKPYATHPQRGDIDFTLADYNSFKSKRLSDAQYFKLIDRINFEMIELKDPDFDVMSYFSNIPLTIQLGIN